MLRTDIRIILSAPTSRCSRRECASAVRACMFAPLALWPVVAERHPRILNPERAWNCMRRSPAHPIIDVQLDRYSHGCWLCGGARFAIRSASLSRCLQFLDGTNQAEATSIKESAVASPRISRCGTAAPGRCQSRWSRWITHAAVKSRPRQYFVTQCSQTQDLDPNQPRADRSLQCTCIWRGAMPFHA